MYLYPICPIVLCCKQFLQVRQLSLTVYIIYLQDLDIFPHISWMVLPGFLHINPRYPDLGESRILLPHPGNILGSHIRKPLPKDPVHLVLGQGLLQNILETALQESLPHLVHISRCKCHYDRCLPVVPAFLPDHCRCLHAVHTGHNLIHENHVIPCPMHQLHSFLPTGSLCQFKAVIFQETDGNSTVYQIILHH